jgi:uncharacterized protein YbcI
VRRPPGADARGEHVHSERGLLLAAISNTVVRVHKQLYGKGPTKARTHLWENLLVVVLEGGLLRSEQTLRDRGRAEAVIDTRFVMQAAIEPELRAAIESELRQRVGSFMNALDPHDELEVLLCTLEPLELGMSDGHCPAGDWLQMDGAGPGER